MIGRLNHVAIAVPDLEAAMKTYKETLGAKVSAPWSNSNRRTRKRMSEAAATPDDA